MSRRCLQLTAVAAALTGVAVLLKLTSVPVAAQRPTAAAKAGSVPKTPSGEPDLQGIWTHEYAIPLQRPARFANKEFFTDEDIAALDKERANLLRRNLRVERGSERDVAGAYNAEWIRKYPSGRRTSRIVDPPDGNLPPLTPEGKQRANTERAFQLALLQATGTCETKEAECAGGTYGPVSPRMAEVPPLYNTQRINRSNGPEDRSLMERCLYPLLPDFTMGQGQTHYHIVQSGGDIGIFYDVGQGWGGERVIPMTGRPHLPSSMRQWWGDSRGHWDGNTLVVDVTNFSPKRNFRESRENLHLVERWTRLDAKTLEYSVTVDDPTTWTRPWTAKWELTKQPDQPNRVYYEPRCHEGNYGLPSLLSGARAADKAFAEGKGPDPALSDSATDFFNSPDQASSFDILTSER